MNDNLVIIDYKDLKHDSEKNNGAPSYNPKLYLLLHKAFGNDTRSSSSYSNDTSQSSIASAPLGLIVIRNIPDFVQTKESFLPLAHQLINLPQSYLNTKLTDESSMYNAGWSHGKEKLKNDAPDLSKGSFYFNPVTDTPGTEQDRKDYPVSYPVNKWPSKSAGDDGNDDGCEIPQFEFLAKKLGMMMKDVVTLLAYQIDEYVKCQCEAYEGCMGKEVKETEKVKGRLLYYFPKDNNDNGEERQEEKEHDSWIGWHCDSGFLTALAGDVYIDHDTGEIIPKEEIDPDAGLYIQDRNGTVTQIRIPDDCMAIQIGECLQIVTGGMVVATPHCVKGADPNWTSPHSKDCGASKKRRVARISFPCFVDTIPTFPLKVPPTKCVDDVLNSSVTGCAKVPPLENR